MDKFIVSARKYRPQNFSSVVGQSHITTTLKNAIRNRQLAHAFLFCGPRGVGKTTCARILAKTINCEHQSPEGEACNQCDSCKSFNEGTSLNIHELDAASNNSVDDIRTLVEQVRFAPQAGEYKVYIIDEVHMLTSSAFNAFLKTLEEPPPYAIFILATTEKHKILPTILSRCQIFDFKRISTNDTVEHLEEICEKESIHADKASLQLIAQKSEGCLRDALSILDKIVSFSNGEVAYKTTLEHLNILDADYYFSFMDAMLQQDLSSAMLLYDDINRKGFEGDLVLNGFAEFARNLLVCIDEKAAQLLDVVESFKEKYISYAKRTDSSYLIGILHILNEAEINYKAARNKRLHVELALIKLCYLQQAITLVNGGEVSSKKKLADNAKAVAFKAIPVIEWKRPANQNQPKVGGGESKLFVDERASDFAKATADGSDSTSAEATVDRFAKAPADAKASASTSAEATVDRYAKAPADAKASAFAEATADRLAGGSMEGRSLAPDKRPADNAPGFGALSKLQQQFAHRKHPNDQENQEPLNMESLEKAWKEFTIQLIAKKNPAAQSFQRAVLAITSDINFEARTNNNLEQKFIEQEKRPLCDFLQEHFNNKNINLVVTVSDNPVTEEQAGKVLTRKEQYQLIVEQYPLVKELKERLRLELDY